MDGLTKKIILLKTNTALTINNKFKPLFEFQIKRLNHFFPDSLWVIDFHELLHKNSIEYEKIFKTHSQLKNWLTTVRSDVPIIIIDSINPLIDNQLVNQLIEQFQKKNESLSISGAIPGTSPDLISSSDFVLNYLDDTSIMSELKKVYWNTQRKYNNQFNLKRPIRIKIFLKLIQKIPSLYMIFIDEFIKTLDLDEIYNYILDYCEENVHAYNVNECPNCKNTDLMPNYYSTSQPTIGFLSSLKPIYFECTSCSLVFLRRQCNIDSIHLFYDEFERPKINEQKLIEDVINYKGGSHFFEKIKAITLIEKYAPFDTQMADLGGGFGEFSCLAKHRNPNWSVSCVDFNLDHVKSIHNKYGIKSINQNFVQEKLDIGYDVITALHVIEHIPFNNLLNFFQNVHSALKNNGFFLITTPNYLSPVAKFLDYHLMFPPVHQTILSNSWLEQFLKKYELFRQIDENSSSVILENHNNWFPYFKETAPYDEFKSVITILDKMTNEKLLYDKFLKYINEENIGSETIMLFQKL